MLSLTAAGNDAAGDDATFNTGECGLELPVGGDLT